MNALGCVSCRGSMQSGDIDFRQALLDGVRGVEINSFCALVMTLCTDDSSHFHHAIHIRSVALSSRSTVQLQTKRIALFKLCRICTIASNYTYNNTRRVYYSKSQLNVKFSSKKNGYFTVCTDEAKYCVNIFR